VFSVPELFVGEPKFRELEPDDRLCQADRRTAPSRVTSEALIRRSGRAGSRVTSRRRLSCGLEPLGYSSDAFVALHVADHRLHRELAEIHWRTCHAKGVQP
jgi:hypothetical protein